MINRNQATASPQGVSGLINKLLNGLISCRVLILSSIVSRRRKGPCSTATNKSDHTGIAERDPSPPVTAYKINELHILRDHFIARLCISAQKLQLALFQIPGTIGLANITLADDLAAAFSNRTSENISDYKILGFVYVKSDFGNALVGIAIAHLPTKKNAFNRGAKASSNSFLNFSIFTSTQAACRYRELLYLWDQP